MNQKFKNVNGQLQPAAPPNFTGEAEITSALIQLSGKSGGQIVFLAGHAERNLEENGNDGIAFAVKQLDKNGWHVEKQVVAPGANASFPTNTAVVVVAGPHQKLSNEDLQAIQEVLDRGGGLLALLDPGVETGMEPLLGPWNIRMADNMVVDFQDHVASADPSSLYVTRFNADHPIGKGMGALAAVLPTCRRIAVYMGQANQAINVLSATIMSTSGNGWATAYQPPGQPFQVDKNRDKKGPISLAVACERYQDVAEPGKNPLQGRMVVIGDSDFISNQYIDMAGNLNLFLNSVDWLAGRQELVSVRPKVGDFRMIAITTNQAKAVLWLSIAVVPGLSLLFGVLAMINRRRRA